MESRSETCIFVGYLKGTRGGFFYSPKDNKVFISRNATFLEKDYTNKYKPKSKVIIEKIIDKTSTPSDPIVEAPIIDETLNYRRTNT